MNRFNFVLIFILSFVSLTSNAQNYYRVWQGFKKPELSNGGMLRALPSFMTETVQLYYPDNMYNYLVVVPPKNELGYMPDEFALVALKTRKQYVAKRATPAGKKYSDRHWDLFNKDNSKSADYVDVLRQKPKSFVSNVSYDFRTAKTVDWAQGHNIVYIGTRKQNVSKADLLEFLFEHTHKVSKTMGDVLKGYVVIANDNYEVAYMNFESEKAMDEVFATPEGRQIADEAGLFMDNFMWTEAQLYNEGDLVHNDMYYSTIESNE